MIILADVVLPVSAAPIRDGAVVIEDGRIQAIGRRKMILTEHPGQQILEFGEAIAMPGLVNLHSHLEYTTLGPLCQPQPFLPWIRSLVVSSQMISKEGWRRSAVRGARMLIEAGVTCTADIVTFGPGLEAALETGLRGVAFIEAVGLRGSDILKHIATIEERLAKAEALTRGSRLQVGLSPHSVYTLSTEALVQLGELASQRQMRLAIHLAETQGECELVFSGEGDLARALSRIGGHNLIRQGGCGQSPVEYVQQCGLLRPQTLAVHCVHVSERDVALLRDTQTAVALCPQSNRLLQAGEAPALQLWQQGVKWGIGTDSLASNYSLDLFAEMRLTLALCQRQAAESPPPSAPTARDLVRQATLGGAQILGLENEIGSLEPGKYADIIVVRMPGAAEAPDLYERLLAQATRDDVLCTMIEGEVAYLRAGAATAEER